MGKWGNCDFKELKTLQENLKKLDNQKQVDQFCEDCAKELAARLLAKVIKRTPVGDYPSSSGIMGGTLRRGWTTQASGSGSEGLNTRGASQYVDTLKVHRYGGNYVIEITNPIEYASYVEYGHRTANHKGWVKGRFMLTISEEEIKNSAPGILNKKLEKYLGECFHDK